MFCDLSPYQSRRCKEIIEGKVENSENVRGLIEFIDAKFKTRAISAFYGAGKDSAWLKIVLRFDKDAAKITDKKCIERYLARTPLCAKLNGLNVKQTSENLNALLKDADTLIASINGAIGGFNGLQKSVRDRVEGGEFDLRASLNPMILEATNLLSDFQKTLRGFRAALDRLEDNPYEFFFKEPVQGADKKGR